MLLNGWQRLWIAVNLITGALALGIAWAVDWYDLERIFLLWASFGIGLYLFGLLVGWVWRGFFPRKPT